MNAVVLESTLVRYSAQASRPRLNHFQSPFKSLNSATLTNTLSPLAA